MGIYDRDYLRTNLSSPWSTVTRTAVGTLLFVNIVVWVLQLLVTDLTEFLFAQRDSVLGFEIWRVVTANFAHSVYSFEHLAYNMLGLFMFGRDVETLYGKRSFYLLYFTAGILAICAQLASSPAPVLGASGAVLAIVTVFALHFPRRIILLFFFLPMPAWLLCVFFVLGDVMGVVQEARGGAGSNVAHLAHLTGAAFGLAFWKFDLRWERFFRGPGRVRKRVPRKRARSKIVPFARPEPKSRERREEDAVSHRIDQLLGKISTAGKDSLSDEEWDFLRENSGRYRSH
jgi:membrane associated rhomboid family serine protease